MIYHGKDGSAWYVPDNGGRAVLLRAGGAVVKAEPKPKRVTRKERELF